MSGKPHELGRHEFQYTYREQSHVVENVVATLNLRDVTFLSFDHGGPIGFNVMTRLPERFSRIIIANSWAWSCHAYPATRIWSMVAPLSKHALRKLMLNKKRWLFETSKDLKNPEVWNACINPYRNARDFAPIAKMAQQLTRAKSYFEELDSKMYTLANKEVDIVWTTKSGGLFPEFVKEEMFLSRWRDIFPNASMNLVADLGYYGLITCPSRTLVNTILRAVQSTHRRQALQATFAGGYDHGSSLANNTLECTGHEALYRLQILTS